MVLTPEVGMQALPMGVYGLLLKGNVGLLLGICMQGIIVTPGINDADFEGEIKVMTYKLQ